MEEIMEELTMEEIMKANYLSVWVYERSMTTELIGKSCVLLDKKESGLGPRMIFHFPGENRTRTIPAFCLSKHCLFTYPGLVTENLRCLERNYLNGILYCETVCHCRYKSNMQGHGFRLVKGTAPSPATSRATSPC